MRRFLIAAALAATVCPSIAGAQTLRIGLREDADMLDPTLARTYVGRIVFAGLCDKLFDINEKLEIVPQLATGYEWANPTTLVIHLRGGVRFHDGEVMDAASVKYSLERHLTMPGSTRRAEIGLADRIEVVDPLTVRIVLKSPSAPFVSQLTDRAGMIVSPKAAQAAGKDFALRPVCAGPFKFTERVAQDRIVLDRFPGYWNASSIHFDRVVYQPIPDASIRLANLRAGTLELTEYVIPSDAETVKNDPKLRLMTSDALGYQGITLNVGNGPRADNPLGKDPRVRKAFELSIDREALLGVVYNGMFPAAAQAVPPESPYYAANVRPPARDLARARALLKEAGVPIPFPINLTATNNSDIRQVAEVIQSMAGEAGFDVRIQTMEFASSLDAAERGEFQAYLLQWSGRIDPDGNLYTFLHSTNGANNYGRYGSKEMDGLLDQGRAVIDLAPRRAIYEQAAQLAARDLPIIYLWTQRNIVGMTARLSGYRAMPDGIVRIQGMQLGR